MTDIKIKEKRYNLFPELLKIHVQRLEAANSVVTSYLKDTELLRSGLVRFEGFLGDANKVEAIKAQIGDIAVCDGKNSKNLVIKNRGTPCFDALEKSIWPVIRVFFQEAALDDLPSYLVNHCYMQHLLNNPDDGDEQKVFHSDTFFHCLKFWYFPHEVCADDGAFWYVPNSPVLTNELIKWHTDRVRDLKDGVQESWRGQGHIEGSFRINVDELKELGLYPEPVAVKADTLVLANVFGFHRRGDTKKPTHRLSIHGSIRFSNPFAYLGTDGPNLS